MRMLNSAREIPWPQGALPLRVGLTKASTFALYLRILSLKLPFERLSRHFHYDVMRHHEQHLRCSFMRSCVWFGGSVFASLVGTLAIGTD
jgi:hypothetical protein